MWACIGESLPGPVRDKNLDIKRDTRYETTASSGVTVLGPVTERTEYYEMLGRIRQGVQLFRS